jgi:hypothetical protein
MFNSPSPLRAAVSLDVCDVYEWDPVIHVSEEDGVKYGLDRLKTLKCRNLHRPFPARNGSWGSPDALDTASFDIELGQSLLEYNRLWLIATKSLRRYGDVPELRLERLLLVFGGRWRVEERCFSYVGYNTVPQSWTQCVTLQQRLHFGCPNWFARIRKQCSCKETWRYGCAWDK